MSADKRKLQVIGMPPVPKLLKHSQSEYQSKLPDIKTMKQTIEPQTDFKPRTTTNRMSSMKRPGAGAIPQSAHFRTG